MKIPSNVRPFPTTPTFGGFRIIAEENKECKYLYNKLIDLVREERVGALFATDFVTISSNKKSIKEKLIKLAIKFVEG